MDIGDIIYNRRKELGLTMEEVGNIVGVNKGTVKKWENGDISNMKRDKIALLAKALKLSPIVLVNGKETELSDEDAELAEYLEELKNRPEMRMLFKVSVKATKEDVEQAVRIIEAIAKKDE